MAKLQGAMIEGRPRRCEWVKASRSLVRYLGRERWLHPLPASSFRRDATGEGPPPDPKSGPDNAPWELTEEIMSVLKTAFPLLTLSMETMVDQSQKYFKCPPDEDAYRLIVALLNDGLARTAARKHMGVNTIEGAAGTETSATFDSIDSQVLASCDAAIILAELDKPVMSTMTQRELELWESNAKPHLYHFVTKFHKKYSHLPSPRDARPSLSGLGPLDH
ncbi:hypothetical protein F4821DRAFT_253984 [Hypoxylon rubiginosum]|uniref:Uncharacterized protein n=1 Tax=Hypoxylon rubiginosum TaxID=110542 RepID=A0ACC0DIN0_9PEZI|nr:hypothetical protein F4821DRAFT_253984 [Hypoxylon rubiginosum]